MEEKKSPKEREEWLDKKPDTFIAYKVVQIKTYHNSKDWEKRYFPAYCFVETPYEKAVNELKGRPVVRAHSYDNEGKVEFSYWPYFHLFESKTAASRMAVMGKKAILKCRVRKKDIKNVGKQWDHVTIVTRRFEIIKRVK